MKKFTSTDLGGAPLYKNDFRDVFNAEIWSVLEALVSYVDSEVEGLIVEGCLITPNGSNFDVSSGIVYLDGEFRRLPDITNQPFTSYIIPYGVVNESRIFADGTTHVVTVELGASVSGASGAGQYITISSLTSADARRLGKTVSPDPLQFIIDGGGATITTGQKGHIVVPTNLTVESVTLLANASGSIVVDLWRDTYANFPPTGADSVCASAKPTLSSATKSQDTTLTGWTKEWNKGDVIAYNVESVTGVQRVTVYLEVKRR